MKHLILILILASIACNTHIAPTDTTPPIYQSTFYTTAPLNVRISPCYGSTVVDTLQEGEPVQVFGFMYLCRDGGLWVNVGAGWVNRRYIRQE